MDILVLYFKKWRKPTGGGILSAEYENMYMKGLSGLFTGINIRWKCVENLMEM